jgi:hypothetical protein
VCLRWGVQNGFTVVPTHAAERSAAETLDVVGWRLSRKAMDALDGLNQVRAHVWRSGYMRAVRVSLLYKKLPAFLLVCTASVFCRCRAAGFAS